MDVIPPNAGSSNFWTDRVTTIFPTLPSGEQWAPIAVGLLLLLSWLYLLFAVRSVKRRTKQIEREIHDAIADIVRPAMEQQTELVRRIGWAVSYLEQIEQKLDHPSAASIRVAEITAQNLVVRHEDRWNDGNRSDEGRWNDGHRDR
jgi:hypothetical protein